MESTAERTTDRPIEVGRVLSETFSTYRSNAGLLLGTAVGILFVAAAIDAILRSSETVLGLLGVILAFAAQTLYTGIVVKLVRDARDGKRRPDIGDLFAAAAPAVGALLLNGIVYGIAVFFGFIFLIVPGLFLITIWAVTAPAIVVERVGPIAAFGRSRELVRGNGWTVFGVIVTVFLIGLGVGLAAFAIGSLGDDAGQAILSAAANIVVAPIVALASSILYFDLGGGPPPAEPPETPEAPDEPGAPEGPTG